MRLQPLQTLLRVVIAEQRHLLALMVDDQRPVINPHRHIRQRDIGLRHSGKSLKTAAQIVTEQPQRAAKKRQILMGLRRERLTIQLLLE